MLHAFDQQEQLRREAAARLTRDMAAERGISPEAMRARLSYYGVVSYRHRIHTERREQVQRLWPKRGSLKEKASYLDLSLAHLRRLASRMGLRSGTPQLCLWPRSFRKRHRVRHNRPCNTCTLFSQPPVQFPIPFPSINDQQRAA